ncbi:MAG TPA: BlaI/MecI/CopY family transcriptional regulator [Acidobacteriota bacterium]|nr:BlaI/MecI/CopY family transcriptional regulator [Acidobacteriota bacterium]
MKDASRLTPAEFEVLEVLWREGRPLSVGDVLEVIRRARSVAYTTVMTVLDKLARKGSVNRVKRGKAYFYTPRVRRSQVLQCAVEEFADNYFRGSESRLLAFLEADGDGSHASNGSPRSDSMEGADSLDVALL